MLHTALIALEKFSDSDCVVFANGSTPIPPISNNRIPSAVWAACQVSIPSLAMPSLFTLCGSLWQRYLDCQQALATLLCSADVCASAILLTFYRDGPNGNFLRISPLPNKNTQQLATWHNCCRLDGMWIDFVLGEGEVGPWKQSKASFVHLFYSSCVY